MKIVITGGSGFIGSAVVRLAIKMGHTVINVDALTYSASQANLSSVSDNERYIFEHVDIRKKEHLSNVFDKYQPDAVMHLAAETHVDRSITTSDIFLETNVFGTFNLLEVVREYWQSKRCPDSFRFHHVSTDEVFGSLPLGSSLKFTEESPYQPRNPYSASKASSDHFVRAWYETFRLPTVLTNCSNNYGPFQYPEKLIPLVVLNALSEKSLPIYGDGSNIRDWLYVEDHADALLKVLKHGEIGKSYNIGGENEISNLDLVRKLCVIMDAMRPRNAGSYKDLIRFVPDRLGHDTRYAINPKRMVEELHWKPKVSLDFGLEKTVNWYLDNENWWNQLVRS